MTDDELIRALEELRDAMVNVSTGRMLIQDVNDRFRATYGLVASALVRRRVENPLPYGDLWDFYGRWKSGDMPTYQSRREYVSSLFTPLIARVRTGQSVEYVPTGWARVDRTVTELRDRLASATSEEQFQAVALLCREALISLAQAVFDPNRHPILDGTVASRTDAKRMLEAYLAVELGGSGNEEARKHARSALELAVAIQHRRTAGFRDAALCTEATTSVINVIAIISGQRDHLE